MPSRLNGIVLLLVGCVVAIVCCIVIVGRPAPDDADVKNLGMPSSTAPGAALPGSTATTDLAVQSDYALE